MDITTISSIAGVLGFCIAVATFIITRMERRKKLIIELFKGYYLPEKIDDSNSDYEAEETIKVRLINIGGKPIILDMESIIISANGRKVRRYKTDWIGIDDVPSPLEVGQSCEVAVFKSAFEEILGFKELDKYCNTEDCEKTRIPLHVTIKDHFGKIFTSDNFKYFLYIGELERNT